MKGRIRVIILLGLLCFGVSCVTQRLPDDPQITALIERLHMSPSENRSARKELVQTGARAVPQLVRMLNVPAHQLRHGNSAIQAARTLRVLHQIQAPEALPACQRILLKEYIRPSTKESATVLNEAIGCVYALFPRKTARDIYYKFVTGDPRQYLKEEVDAQHWGGGQSINRLAVDVLTGFSLMVQAKDSRVRPALLAFLDSISGEALQRMYFHQLAENGFTVTELTTSKEQSELERLVKP